MDENDITFMDEEAESEDEYVEGDEDSNGIHFSSLLFLETYAFLKDEGNWRNDYPDESEDELLESD